jgi:hypothetical protein
MAEVFAHRTEDGAPVVLWPHYGGTSQQFTVERLPPSFWWKPVEEQWFLLRARHSGKCLRTNRQVNGSAFWFSEGVAALHFAPRCIRQTGSIYDGDEPAAHSAAMTPESIRRRWKRRTALRLTQL